MKDWKFIKIGNTSHSDKVDVIKRLLAGGWSVKDIYDQLKTEGYEVEKNFIEKLKTGNEAVGPNWDKKRQLEDELRGWMTMVNKLEGEEKRNAEKQIADIRKELNDVKIKIAHGENKKAGNESIDKQEWSMFKGLTKKAEEEVGNARSKEQLLADVRELTKYIQEHNGQGCEKEKRLLGEAKEELDKYYGVIVGNSGIASIGPAWMHGGTVYGKMDTDESGKKHNEYVKITWLGSGKGGVANYFVDDKIQSDKFGSLDKNELKRWAESKIGNDTLGQWAKAKPRVINDESTRMRNEYNAEIQRLTKKAEQLRSMGQGRSAMEIEKQIEKLGKELRELGNKKVGNTTWKQTGSQKWETELPNGSKIVVYYEKGEMADWNYQIDHKKSNTYIGSWARDKQEAMTESVERAKRLGNFKTGNETLGQWAKAKPRIINETKGERKFGKVMGEFEEGALKTPQGKTVTDPAQAKAIAYSEAEKVDNLKRARNAMAKNKQITLWNGNDTVLISEDGTVQYLESNSFEVDRAKYDSQEKAIEELTKEGYRKK